MRAIFLVFTVAAVAYAQQTSPHAQFPRKLCAGCAERVSIVQLIATPEKYDGHLIAVEGYLSVEFEDFGLYLSHDDYDHLNGDNAVWVDFKPGVLKGPAGMTPNDNKALQGKFVLVEGTFDANSHGHMGAFAGAIHEISRIVVGHTRTEYEKMSGSKNK